MTTFDRIASALEENALLIGGAFNMLGGIFLIALPLEVARLLEETASHSNDVSVGLQHGLAASAVIGTVMIVKGTWQMKLLAAHIDDKREA